MSSGMMTYLSDFVFCLFDHTMELNVLIVLFAIFFGKRPSTERKNVLLTVLLLIGFSLIAAMERHDAIYLIFYIIFVVTEIKVLYRINGYKKVLFRVLWGVSMVNVFIIINISIVDSIFKYYGIQNDKLRVVFSYMIIFIFLAIISKIFNERRKYVTSISLSHYIMYMIIGTADYIILTFISKAVESIEDKQKGFVVFIIVSLSIFFQLALTFLTSVTNEGLKSQYELNQKYIRLQQENYNYLEMREEETKKFRHDYRNHMNFLQILCKDKRYDEVIKYMEDLTEKVNLYSRNVSVGNNILDAILNYYYDVLKSRGIELKVAGKMPPKCKIEMFDINTILSNLIDNAGEAVKELADEDKWVELKVRYDEMMIYFKVTNPYDGKVYMKENEITTRKKNKQYHGYGLKNVQNSIETYDGMININTENNKFEVIVVLVNTEKIKRQKKYKNEI